MDFIAIPSNGVTGHVLDQPPKKGGVGFDQPPQKGGEVGQLLNGLPINRKWNNEIHYYPIKMVIRRKQKLSGKFKWSLGSIQKQIIPFPVCP